MTAAVLMTALAASAVCILRSLRLVQREHYIAGSCFRILRLWCTVRPPNAVIFASMLLGAGGALLAPTTGSQSAAALAAALAAMVLPVGMPILGRDTRLVATRRLRTLAVVVVVLAVALGCVLFLLFGTASSLAVVPVLVPLVVDGGAALTKPLEARLARNHRAAAEAKLRQVNPLVIAITGSYGKTSTKNHVRELISGSQDVVASPASWNNSGGLSRAINEHLRPSTEVFVAEMGTYGPGEIRDLCSWIRPDIAVITAIGPMHLERMGSLDNIVRAKAEILERARVIVLNVEDPRLAGLAIPRTVEEVWRCGTASSSDLDVAVIPTDSGHAVRIRGREWGPLSIGPGIHLGNLACAVAAASAAGIPGDQIAARIPSLTPPEHRAVVARTDTGVMLVDDTFNSNPAGAAKALDEILGAVADGRRVAVVTPGMVELGPEQQPANQAFASSVSAAGATLVVVGWTNRRALLEGAAAGETVVVPSRAAARDWVSQTLNPGDGVLWENDLPDHYP